MIGGNVPIEYLHGVEPKGFGRTFRWKTTSDVNILLSDGTELKIPKGFKTDLASVPRFLWSAFPPYGDFLIASLAHDYMYISKYRCYLLGKNKARKFADDEMYYLSSCYNPKNPLDNYIRWVAVRLFGWLLY